MKKTIFILFVLFCGIDIYAQRPMWIKNTPKPNDDTYFYYSVKAKGENYKEAYKDAEQQICEVILNRKGSTTDVVIENGDVYYQTRTGQKFSWPRLKVCEWQDPSSKSDWYFLYQVAESTLKKANFHTYGIDQQIDNSEKRRVDRQAALRSLCPGWGLRYKGHKTAGWCVLGAEALLIGGGITGIVIAQRQDGILDDPKANVNEKTDAQGIQNDAYKASKICFITAGGVYLANILLSYLINDKNHDLALSPVVIPTNKNLAFGISASIKF